MSDADLEEDDHPQCPYCGAKMTKVMFGLPAWPTPARVTAQLKAGELEFGGCVIDAGDVGRYCRGCKRGYSVAGFAIHQDETGNWIPDNAAEAETAIAAFHARLAHYL